MRKNNTTPYLNQPNSSRQHFTYAENQLLDQITRELVEGWKSDLRKLNASYQKSLASSENIYRMSSMLADKLTIVEEIIKDDSFKELYKNLTRRNEEISFRLEEINLRLIEIETISKRLDQQKEPSVVVKKPPAPIVVKEPEKQDLSFFEKIGKFFRGSNKENS